MTLKPAILNALRKGTDTVIRFDPTVLELQPAPLKTKGQGGVVKMVPQEKRPPQTFLVQSVGATLAGVTGTSGGAIATDGAQGHSWSYTITGRYDCQMEIGDTWQDGETTYRITAINPTNGYERVGVVEALGKDPRYGV
ncbi:hypothetical protein HWC80_gp016 [Mycobacterium phage Indlulamithi]|uniref:Head-to-tail stopper n=1 Tax=Mycobacterium phage Indlulamithi TaxID=2656582 RepID=A0A649VCK5_9CAUD|nr:hypothetical protein HWC80_gp016 [Mycobacterium phage Indlulamithi]QGJ90057.1 hypothetical protein PBI_INDLULAMITHI_16 [Mycobacterium phage Indlulamithi]